MAKKKTELILAIVVLVAVVVVAAALAINAAMSRDTNDAALPITGETVTVEGEYVCLPKEGDGPHTLECALGLHDQDNDTYYGLDFMGVTADPGETVAFEYAIGDELRVSGVFRESDEDDTFVSVGTIEVESIEQL